MPKPSITTLDHLVLTVADIERTCQFFETVLGCARVAFHTASGERRVALTFGQQKINLHQAGREFEPKAARPTPGCADLCFLTDTPLEDWLTHLASLEIEVEEGPIARTGAVSPLMSIYIRDPDGNLIEVAEPR